MKKVLCFLLSLVVVLTGCTASVQEPNDTEVSLGNYKTLLSPKNELSIVREPDSADYSFINPEKMTELPSSHNEGQRSLVEIRSSDLSLLNLEERLDDLLYSNFDSKTIWPDTLPKEFNPDKVMELGKNPGLGVRKLHDSGITGKGIGIAVIDQGLLVNHIEYKDQLKLYEEIHCGDKIASMHGPAVASIAVGKTVGVAPEADLYYIAETHGVFTNAKFEFDLAWLAKSIDRIVEINKLLDNERKIKVISISLGINEKMKNYNLAKEAIEKAEEDGIYTVFVGCEKYLGLGRDPLLDADNLKSYSEGEFWKGKNVPNNFLLIPMDSRCTASPTGNSDYVFYRTGGVSWSVPYVAALYVLAYQVNPNITPELFWKEAFSTSDKLNEQEGNEVAFRVINPVKLIENLSKVQ